MLYLPPMAMGVASPILFSISVASAVHRPSVVQPGAFYHLPSLPYPSAYVIALCSMYLSISARHRIDRVSSGCSSTIDRFSMFSPFTGQFLGLCVIKKAPDDGSTTCSGWKIEGRPRRAILRKATGAGQRSRSGYRGLFPCETGPQSGVVAAGTS